MALCEKLFNFLAACVIIYLANRAVYGVNSFSFPFGFPFMIDVYEVTKGIAPHIRIKTYNGSSIETALSSDIPVKAANKIYDCIDHSKPLVLYIHGFNEHPRNESVRTVVGAHLRRGIDNIMLLDWSDLAFGNYITVASKVPGIARILTQTFDDLVQMGLHLETFHVVGHSLGAQIGGYLGKYSINLIPRITGLDPAKPGFYHPGADHLDADSAKFVDVVHTDGGLYGALSSTGSVDFFANGGTRPQPGCYMLGLPFSPYDLCSHRRSWRYYAESVSNERAFPAVQCPSYVEFLSGKCARNRRVYFGYFTSTDARGSFYFMTNDESPFSAESSRNNADNLLETEDIWKCHSEILYYSRDFTGKLPERFYI